MNTQQSKTLDTYLKDNFKRQFDNIFEGMTYDAYDTVTYYHKGEFCEDCFRRILAEMCIRWLLRN